MKIVAKQKTCGMCDRPSVAKGLCPRDYKWERYHIKAQHGYSYMIERSGVLRRQGERCDKYAEALAPKRSMTQSIASAKKETWSRKRAVFPVKQAHKLFRSGESIHDLAEKFDLDHRTILRAFAREGLAA